MKFEEALKKLDEIIALLENPDVSLEDSVNYYKNVAELLVTVEESE